MILERLSVGIYGVNCFIVGCEKSKEAIIVDPGGDAEEILLKLVDLGLKAKYIILTHAHGDHIGGLQELKKEIGIPILIHEDDEEFLKDATKNLSSMMSINNVEITPDRILEDGDKIKFGELEAEIIHTPGHTRGSICIKINDIILTGDTLFRGSIGRTDLQGGSFEKIINSIKEKLINFDDEVKVLPGHGPASTIGKEKATNPFIK